MQFAGWDPALPAEGSDISNNMTFKAKYIQGSVLMSFKDWDEEILKQEQVKVGQLAEAPDIVEEAGHRPGFVFQGWDRAVKKGNKWYALAVIGTSPVVINRSRDGDPYAGVPELMDVNALYEKETEQLEGEGGARPLCHEVTEAADPSLCYKYRGERLIYKKGGNYKCDIEVVFGAQSWVCNTYDCYHEIDYECTGSGMKSKVDMGISSATFEVDSSPNGIFEISVTAITSCGALEQEDPGASCNVSASQRGVAPKVMTDIKCPPNSAVSILVEFDEDGKLKGIRT